MLYDMQTVLLDGNDNNDKVKSNPTNLSFDKAAFSDLLTDTRITQPHVNTIYENKYPWVVTIAKEYSNLYARQVLLRLISNSRQLQNILIR